MDNRTIQALELDKIIDILKGYTSSPLGCRIASNLSPTADRAVIVDSLQKTREMLQLLEGGGVYDFRRMGDLEPVLQKLGTENLALTADELLHSQAAMDLGWDFRERLKNSQARAPALYVLSARIPDFREIARTVSETLEPTGEVKDRASQELARIRRAIRRLREGILARCNSVLKGSRAAIQDEVITFRNGRMVVPVRSELKTQVPGIVHGKSSSGMTVFVEPYEAVEDNNRLTLLLEQENEEVERILLALTSSIRDRLTEFHVLLNVLGEVDFTQAKGVLARQMGAGYPILSERGVFSLIGCRHPLLVLQSLKRSVVANSIVLDDRQNTMIITGPNAGGKTVALKTAGLLSLMLQCGMLIPANTESEVPIFKSVFAEIGDNQNLAQNLSTFSAHLKNIQSMVENYEEPGLVLVDEVGAGTAPSEGAALGIAITDYFHRRGAKTIVTTHQEQLKQYAMQTDGITNASLDFDEKTCRPLYRLVIGVPGRSNALKIAEQAGFPEEILRSAKEYLEETATPGDHLLARMETLLRENERRKEELDGESARLRELEERLSEKEQSLEKERRRVLVEEAAERKEETRRILKQLSEECSRVLQDVGKDVYLSGIQARVRKRIRQLEQTAAEDRLPEEALQKTVSAGELKKGDRVRWNPFNIEAVVEELLPAARVVGVLVKGKKVFLAPEELEPLGGDAPPARSSGVHYETQGEETYPVELNLIGQRVEEALRVAERFIDRALLGQRPSVRLIHGHGTGRLKKAIRDWLAEQPGIVGYHDAPTSQGGSGVTVVDLDV